MQLIIGNKVINAPIPDILDTYSEDDRRNRIVYLQKLH